MVRVLAGFSPPGNRNVYSTRKPLQLSHKNTSGWFNLSMGSYCRNRDHEVAKVWEWDFHIAHLYNIISHIYIIVAIYMCPKTLLCVCESTYTIVSSIAHYDRCLFFHWRISILPRQAIFIPHSFRVIFLKYNLSLLENQNFKMAWRSHADEIFQHDPRRFQAKMASRLP